MLKKARVSRGIYACAGYNRPKHNVPVSCIINGKRARNVAVDHISPIGDFVNWDRVIERMFVEEDGLQVLCKKCHDEKTQQEKQERKKNGPR